MQTVASAAEELSGSIVEIGRQIAESTRIAEQAVEEADRTNVAVTGLAEAAQKIGAVVSLINDIAEQINLLALNATIEWAFRPVMTSLLPRAIRASASPRPMTELPPVRRIVAFPKSKVSLQLR